jgi:hypothetical protein
MSSPSLPAEGPLGPSDSISTCPAATDIGDVGDFISELATGVSALSVDVARGGPPPEVREQILATAQIAERMRENGYELRFFGGGEGARPRIELHDTCGAVLSTLSTVDALALIAAGPHA